MSETCPIVAISHVKPSDAGLDAEAKLGIVTRTGFTLSLVQVAVLDPGGRELPPGAGNLGELVLRAYVGPRRPLYVGAAMHAAHGFGEFVVMAMVRLAPKQPAPRFAVPFLAMFCAVLATCHAVADTARTQAIALQAGWNAVWLEVQPAASSPATVFGGLPVTTVAWFRRGGLDAKYIQNPGDAPWRAEGWSVWRSSASPDAVLNDLNDIQAGQAYLVQATAATTWTVTGAARATRLEWQPNNCTLTGLPVERADGITFAQFFAGSPAHSRLRIFRLDAGIWKLVRDPSTARPRPGEAMWIQTDGASIFQGPLAAVFPATGAVDFGTALDAFTLRIACGDAAPVAGAVLTTQGGANAVPLLQALPSGTVDGLMLQALPSPLALGTVPPDGPASIRIQPDRVAMTTATATTLLKISDPRGLAYWIPVSAAK